MAEKLTDIEKQKQVVPTIDYDFENTEDDPEFYTNKTRLKKEVHAFYTIKSLTEFKDKVLYTDNGLEIPSEPKYKYDIIRTFGVDYAPKYFMRWFKRKIQYLVMKSNEYLTWSDAKIIYNGLTEFFACKDYIYFYHNFYVHEKSMEYLEQKLNP